MKLSGLTDRQINDKVAALNISRGVCCRCDNPATIFAWGAYFCSHECGERVSDMTLDFGQAVVPDYCNSLEEMRKLEIQLKSRDNPGFSSRPYDYPSWEYMGNLMIVLGLELYDNGTWVGGNNSASLFPLVNATARQKAEAYIMTLTK